MSTSGSTNYTQTMIQIIKGALRIVTSGTDFEPDEINDAKTTLNMLVKSWQAEGIGLWKNAEVALFLGEDSQSYTLGPTGDHCAETFVKTEVATAAASGASAVIVDSITGMTTGDNVGVELDGGDLQWTTISGAPSSLTIALTDALTDAVAVDNHVYTYTNKIARPLEIVEVRLHKNDDTEITLGPFGMVTRLEYMAIPNKDLSGACNQVFHDYQTIDSKLYVWPVADSVKEYLKMTVRLPIEDFDATSDNADFPVEWLNALKWNLAIEMSNDIGGRDPTPFMVAKAMQTKDAVSEIDVDMSSVFIEVI